MSTGERNQSAEDHKRAHEAGPLGRREFLGGALGAGALLAACNASPAGAAPTAPALRADGARTARQGFPVLVGSNNALPGMQRHYARLLEGADPLGVAIDVVKLAEADPEDDSVGLGGLPNEDGVVQLDAACMYGPRHKSGAVAALEDTLHPSEVARLVLERTDHCLLVGADAVRFARAHGHARVELLTDASRRKWLEWKENLSTQDDRLPPPTPPETGDSQGALPQSGERTAARARRLLERPTGTIHVSALGRGGALACTTTTSGLAWKIPGRVGDSPIIGAGLYCDQEAGSAGATGRGEACILANGSFAIVELLRQGATPQEAGLEVLRRVTRQTQRQARWQGELLDAQGLPAFNLVFYVLGLDGSVAGVCLRLPKQTERATFAVATPDAGPRLLPLVGLHQV